MTLIITSAVTPLALYDGDLAASSSTAVGVANTAYLVAVTNWVEMTLTGIRVRFGTGGAGHYDVGIYDSTGTNGAAGNLLAHAASTATSLVTATGFQTPSFIGGATLDIKPAVYWLALWIDNATDTIVRVLGSANMIIVQSGTNAGPLPALASSLSGLGNTSFKPIIIGMRSGGWS